MRVDGVLVRLLESRVVATFGSPGLGPGSSSSSEDGSFRALDVLRETTHSGGDFEGLVAAGAPGPAPAAGASAGGGPYADGDAAAQALSAVAPVGVTRFVTERLVLRAP